MSDTSNPYWPFTLEPESPVETAKTIEIVANHLPTIEESLARFKPGDNCEVLDSRDAARLAQFLRADQLAAIGMKLADDATPEEHDASVIPWNAETVAKQIASDVEFAFSKSLGKRGISASLMNDVLKMWHSLLSLPFVVPEYPMYGLPMCKVMALYFDLPNQIGDQDGTEEEFDESY